MAYLTANNHDCGTCAFWTGLRKPDVFRTALTVDDSAKGECTGGVWNRSIKTARSTCPDWLLWAGLQGNNTNKQNGLNQSTSNFLFETKSDLENNLNYSSFDNNVNRGYKQRKMHWIYFLLIGWWLGFVLPTLNLEF